MSLTVDHVELLARAAITATVAEEGGVRSAVTMDEVPESAWWCAAVPGLVFPWWSPSGVVVEQYRPDEPPMVEGVARRYVWPKGQSPVLNVHPSMAGRLATCARLVVVEGTKQTLAAVTAAIGLPDVAVVGIAGCYGYVTDGQPIADLGLVPWTGKAVSVVFDADVATNRNVFDAAQRLVTELDLRGASSVGFVTLPGSGKDGLDDVLASRAGSGSTSAVFDALLRRAGKLPRRPAERHEFFGPDGLKVNALHKAVRRQPLAVDRAGRLLVYRDGVYVDGRQTLTHTVAAMLGDRFRGMHMDALVDVLTAGLHHDGLVVPDVVAGPWLNVHNGLLNPFTGELRPHTPEHLSLVQFPLDWDETAACPMFDRWLAEVADGRGDDLLESASLILDMRGERQRKAIYLLGPTRSGKSTFVRLLERIVGYEARSAVTLHELASDRFATADLYGKVLNSGAELSAAHIDDLSVFKAVTGDEPIRAQRKYGQSFVFHNRALFVFSANVVPTVGEVSGAYLARVRPFQFPHSFLGHEDDTIEARMIAELSGIFVRLVHKLRTFEQRGGYVDDAASRAAMDNFARHSDRVRLFLHETCTELPTGFTRQKVLFDAFEDWARMNRRQPLGKHRFLETVSSAGFRRTTRTGHDGFAGLALLPADEWGALPDDPGGESGVSPNPGLTREKSEKEDLMRQGCSETPLSPPDADAGHETTLL